MEKEYKHIRSKTLLKAIQNGAQKVMQKPFSKFKDKRPSWMVDFDVH